MTGNIKTDPIITGRSWESCSSKWTMVIDFPPLSLKEPISHFSSILICETLRLYAYQIKKFVYSLIHWKICWKAFHYSFRNCPSFSYRTPLKYAAPHLLGFYKKPRWISLSALFNRATTEKENKACWTFPHSVVLINITGYETHFQG